MMLRTKCKFLICSLPACNSTYFRCEIPFEDVYQIEKSIEDYEDRNLSLIGHFQQSQEELEGIKKSHFLTMNVMNRQMQMLKSHLMVIEVK